MKGLVVIPGQAELARAYDALLHQSPAAPSASDLALFSQWARFDARLAEIWVAYLTGNWRRINPMELRTELRAQPWPAACGPLLEFVARATARDKASAGLYSRWKVLVLANVEKARWEQFFIGQRRVAGRLMLDDARFSLAEYRKWGFLAREILFNKQMLPVRPESGTGNARTHTLRPETRIEILKSLLETSERITTGDYWSALRKAVSRRQAERDLRACPLLSPIGRTRGRCFVKR